MQQSLYKLVLVQAFWSWEAFSFYRGCSLGGRWPNNDPKHFFQSLHLCPRSSNAGWEFPCAVAHRNVPRPCSLMTLKEQSWPITIAMRTHSLIPSLTSKQCDAFYMSHQQTHLPIPDWLLNRDPHRISIQLGSFSSRTGYVIQPTRSVFPRLLPCFC